MPRGRRPGRLRLVAAWAQNEGVGEPESARGSLAMTGTMIDLSAADGGGVPGLSDGSRIGRRARDSWSRRRSSAVNVSLRAVADLFAEEGYVCLVPDLFWRLEAGLDLGYDGADLARAFELYERFDVDQESPISATPSRRCARPPRMHRPGRRDGLLPRRQARLPHRRAPRRSMPRSASTGSGSKPRSTNPAASPVPC